MGTNFSTNDNTNATVFLDTLPNSTVGDGLRIGGTASSLIGLYDATPSVQSAAITAVTGGSSQADMAVAVNALITAMESLGKIAAN